MIGATSSLKLVYPLASSSLIFGVLQVPFSVLLAAQGQFIGILTGFGALALMLTTIRTVSTKVTETEVSQLTWSGRVHLPWAEITHVQRTPRSVTLTGHQRQVVVAVEFFENTAAALSYIDSHLPSHLSRN